MVNMNEDFGAYKDSIWKGLTAVFIPNMIASNVLQRTIRIAVKNLLLQ